MNIAEIWITIHHLRQRPALVADCASDNMSRITTIQQALLRDEVRHVACTAVLIERRMHDAAPNRLADVVCMRLHNFNATMVEALGNTTFDCSDPCCAKRPWRRAKVTPSDLHA